MNQTRDNPVLESILVAIICTLMIVGLSQLPGFNFLICLVSVPMVVLAKRRGQLFAALSLAIMGAMVGIMDIYLALFVTIMYAAVIIAVPYVIDRRLDLAESIVICAGATFVAMIVSLKVLSLMVGEDIFTYTWNTIRKVFATDNEFVVKLLETYKTIGILDNTITTIQFGELVIDRLKLLTPSILAISAIIYGGANFLISRRVLKRYNIYVQDIPKFERWKLPRGTTRGFLVIMLLSSLGNALEFNNFAVVGATVSMLFTFIFSVQGLSVSTFLLKRSKIPVFVQYVILIFLFLLLKTPLTFVGVFDQIFNIRGIRNKPKGDG